MVQTCRDLEPHAPSDTPSPPTERRLVVKPGQFRTARGWARHRCADRNPRLGTITAMSKRTRSLNTVVIGLLCASLLSACSSTKQTPPGPDENGLPQPAVLDSAITELLPIGPHEVDLRMEAPNGSLLTVKGYLDLGEAVDGSQCRMDLAVVQDIKGDNPSLTRIDIRRDGPVTWQRLVDTTSDLPADVSKRWVDTIDFNAVRPALIFAPLYVTDGMPVTDGGGSGICTLRLLDQTAALDPETDKIVYDLKRVSQYMAAAFGRFTESFLRAGGAGDTDVAEFLPQLVERGTPDYAQMLGALQLTAYRKGEVLHMNQEFQVAGFTLAATFTPTELRTVEQVDEGVPFFDRLDKDPIHDETVAELLRDGLDAWLAPEQSSESTTAETPVETPATPNR